MKWHASALLCLAGWLLADGAHAQAERPNILLAIADDQSWPHTSINGCAAVRTPAFDRVAKSGVLFRNCVAASPGCSPSRAALLTGRHHWQLEHAGTHASSFSANHIVFPDLLQQAGYAIGYTGKPWGPGNWRAGGRKTNPAGPGFNAKKGKPPFKGMHTVDYAGNFELFLDQKPDDQPFLFWYGASEPHRAYEKGAGLKSGKRLEDVAVPGFFPDTPEIRSDLLDYLVEIEWFDTHLARMITLLEKKNALENTLIIVTADNGMPFPRAKANGYEYGIHVPLAISWPARVPGNRKITDPVGFVDLTATILDAAKVPHPRSGAAGLMGRSLMDILSSKRGGRLDPRRTMVFSGRERHSSSRWNNLGYPIRSLRTDQFLYIRNFKPDRWPAGDPRKYDKPGQLGPEHGGYHDIDACPTFDFMKANRGDPQHGRFFQLSVGKRPGEELYDIVSDPDCLRNLATASDHEGTLKKLREAMTDYLTATGDPRMGTDPDVWETYKRYSRMRSFPGP